MGFDLGLLLLAFILALCLPTLAAGMALLLLRDEHALREEDQIQLFRPNPPVPQFQLPVFEFDAVRLRRPQVVSPPPQTEPPHEAVERALRVRELASTTQSIEESADETQTGLTDRVSPPPPLEVNHPDSEERTRRIRAFALKHTRV